MYYNLVWILDILFLKNTYFSLQKYFQHTENLFVWLSETQHELAKAEARVNWETDVWFPGAI